MFTKRNAYSFILLLAGKVSPVLLEILRITLPQRSSLAVDCHRVFLLSDGQDPLAYDALILQDTINVLLNSSNLICHRSNCGSEVLYLGTVQARRYMGRHSGGVDRRGRGLVMVSV